MATSLQELLAEEGFKGRNSGSGSRSRASIRLEAFSNTDSPLSHVAKTERRRSDASRFTSRADLSRSHSTTTHMKPRDHLVRRGKLNVGGLEGRGSSEDFRVNEIVEIEVGETERVKQVFANVGRHSLGRRDKRNDDASSTKHLLNRRSYSDKNRNNPKQKDAAYDSIQPFPQPALDEVAVQAVVSILSGYIKRFLFDEEFRAALHIKCFSSLNFIGLEDHDIEGQVIANLEQAIGIVEKGVREHVSGRELKMASLQLSVITGLNSNDLKDGFTFGVPNSMLSSCAHLYLSVIYKVQKKDRVSARHLLHVFCDSPSHARMNLLPELWDDLFSPHLSHLEAWYDQESSSLSDAPRREMKLKVLEKVYDEIMDSSTYRLATYYKDWLTEGVEAPSFPSIRAPSVSVRSIHQEDSLPHSPGLATPTSPVSPQPTMVSKKLYESVFGRSSKPGLEDNESHYNDTCGRSSDSSTIYVKQTLTCSSETVKYSYQNNDEAISKSLRDDASFLNNGEAASKNPRDDAFFLEDGISSRAQDYDKLHAPVHSTAKELVLKITDDLTLSSLPNLSEDLDRKDFICPMTGKLFEDPVTLETGQTFERVAIKEWLNQGNRTCPVTGNLLELLSVPHTNIILKRVIDSWKAENCSQNLALAFSIVGNTKEHELPNRGETATFILDEFLTTLSNEERITNTKHFISLGGLPFLIQRFDAGNMQEKIRVASLLSCCIKADSVCRYRIAREISKQRLFELVCSKQVNSRTIAVLLLTELICLSRRKDVTLFLSDLQDEEIMNLMHVLHEHLRKISPVQRPLVATLLLNINLQTRKHAIYRRDAVDAITEALDCSLIDREVRGECCRMLRMLGGRFSLSGKLLIEDWILKVAGFDDDHEVNSIENDSVLSEDEECAIAEWMRNLSSSLVGNGKRSFLEAISRCLGSGHRDLVTACLTTVAWLTSVLPIQSDAGLQKTLCTLISQLKQSLQNDAHVQHKVLASMSLLNLSKISEYRVLLMSIAQEMVIPLRSLADVTWTAKELFDIISCT